MSKALTMARLEALLSRIQKRAAEPRAIAVQHVAPAAEPLLAVAVAVSQPPQDEIELPPLSADVAPRLDEAARSAILELDEPAEDLDATVARQVPEQIAAMRAPARTETEIVVDVEVQAATQETVIAIAAEESAVPEASQSRERLVAAEPVADEASTAESPAAEMVEASAVLEVQSVLEVAVEEPVEEEEAPASSRRPVAPPPEERLEEMAFGASEPEPPRHTPPPESGRLPAASEEDYDADITGVRSSGKSVHPAAAPIDLVPEATLADLSSSARMGEVADVVGNTSMPALTTFVAVLDVSIAL
jgi:hypothetical protein